MNSEGFLLIVLGGVMEGLFAFPMKFTPKWSWENMWAAGSLAALILIPWPIAMLTIPHLGAVYASAPASAIVLAILFGAGWGCGGVFYGLGVSSLGLSIGTSLIMGLIGISGSLTPMLLQHRDQMFTHSGKALLLGIATMVLGLVVCAFAGNLKVDSSRTVGVVNGARFRKGLLFCVASGLLSGLVNFGLIYGAPITAPAMARGVDPATANNAVWALVFTGCYLVNIIYCCFRAAKGKTFHKFSTESTLRYWALAGIMGLLWAGGIVVYGRGAALEGRLGPILGFPIMLIVSVLTGNVAGAISGEWRGQPLAAKATMAGGLLIMLLATVSFGYVNYVVR